VVIKLCTEPSIIHTLNYIPVSAYRKGNSYSDQAKPFNIDRAQFSNIFTCVLPQSLVNVGKNKICNMKRSANGHNIIDLATKIKENEDVQNQLAILLEPMYHEISTRQLQVKEARTNHTNKNS
jgi:hypothetical protein